MRKTIALTLAACAIAAGTVALPAAARPDRQTVVAGNARFQVLSPTLIRTEYAGDGRFQDAATFNAVGRDDFTPTPFTSSTARRRTDDPDQRGNADLPPGLRPVRRREPRHQPDRRTRDGRRRTLASADLRGRRVVRSRRPDRGRLGRRHRPQRLHRRRIPRRLRNHRRPGQRRRQRRRSRGLHTHRPVRQRHRRRRQTRSTDSQPVRRRWSGPEHLLRPDRRLGHLVARLRADHAQRRPPRREAQPLGDRLGQPQPRQLRRPQGRHCLPARVRPRLRRLRLRGELRGRSRVSPAARRGWRATTRRTPDAGSSPSSTTARASPSESSASPRTAPTNSPCATPTASAATAATKREPPLSPPPASPVLRPSR